MFCRKCGKEIMDEAVICPNCGCSTKDQIQNNFVGTEYDASSPGMAVLGFFIPIVGFILYLVWKDKTPLKAKSAGKGALIGFIVGMITSIIYGVIIGIAGASYLL